MQVRAYLRVSTEEQAEEGFSIPAQRQRVTDFCRSQWGGVPICWYVDDGESARTLDRPALARLRAEAERGDVVMVLRLDRLTRSVLDLYTLLQEWDHRSIFFRSVTEPYDTTSTEGRFMIGLLALLAEWERLRIAERVREVMAHTVRQEGRHLSRPPLGYQLDQGRLVICPHEAPLVKEIFERYAAGQGTRTIARALNRRGLRTKQGREWTDSTVAYTLRNPVYTGKVAWGRIVSRGRRQTEPESPETLLVEGSHPPLVDALIWERAQEQLARRRERPGRQGAGIHPLTGLARCGLCDGPIHGLTQRRRREGRPVHDGVRHYYRCANRDRKGACRLPYLPAAPLEEQVLRRLGRLGSPALLEAVAARFLGSAPAEWDTAAAEQQEIRRRLRRWDQAYEAGDLTQEDWRQRTLPLRRRLDELEERHPPPGRQTPVSAADVARALADLPGLWPALTPAERRIALHGLVKGVTVHPDGSVAVTPVASAPTKGTP
ncbi:MAG: recombinase family protein [Bacillota bacterium]